jgi:HlyD family secretion protein
MGETPPPTTEVNPPIRLVDERPRVIRGSIDEIDLSRIKVGAPARVKISAVRSEPFEAAVKKIIPFISTLKEQDRTSKVELELKPGQISDPVNILVGASADIEIIVEAKDQVLAIPTKVILGTGKHRYVFRHYKNRIKRVEITTGIGNYDRTEIVSGIAVGDVVVELPEDFELKDDVRAEVKIEPWP